MSQRYNHARLRSVFSFSAIGAIVLLITAFAASPSQSGAPPQRTGAPGDGTGAPGKSGTCSDVGCHNSFDLNSGSGSVTINAPGLYVPGETIAITVVVAQAGATRFGFEITAKDSAGEHLGSWVLGTNTRKTIGDPNYLTHSVVTESEWTFGWQSPSSPVNATFYVAGNAADGQSDAAGDFIYTANKAIIPNTIAGLDDPSEFENFKLLSVYPNPVRGRTTVEIRLSSPLETSIVLIDLTGREVSKTDFGVLSVGTHELPVAVADLSSGLYALSIRAGDEQLNRAITVLRNR